MSALRHIAETATRLHGCRQVREISPARAFRVHDDTEKFTVYLRDAMEHGQCTCPAVGVCEHIGAAMLEADATDTLVLETIRRA